MCNYSGDEMSEKERNSAWWALLIGCCVLFLGQAVVDVMVKPTEEPKHEFCPQCYEAGYRAALKRAKEALDESNEEVKRQYENSK